MNIKLILNAVAASGFVAAAILAFSIGTNTATLFGCVSVLAAIEFYLRTKDHFPRETK